MIEIAKSQEAPAPVEKIWQLIGESRERAKVHGLSSET